MANFDVRAIGVVESSLTDLEAAPRQPDQGAPSAWLVFEPAINPIGLHQVELIAIEGARVRVRSLEALNGTPILDVKPVLSEDVGRR